MSHYVKAQTKMSDKEYLMGALSRMGIEAKEGTEIGGSYIRGRKVDIQINKSVGMVQQADGTYTIEGDFYGTEHRQYYNNEKKFQEELQLNYLLERTEREIEDLGGGWYISENMEAEAGEDGTITMVATTDF